MAAHHKPSVRSLFSPRAASVSSNSVKRTSSITNALRTASVGTAFVGNSKFHISLRNQQEGDSNDSLTKESPVRKESAVSFIRKSPYFLRRSPFTGRKSKCDPAKEIKEKNRSSLAEKSSGSSDQSGSSSIPYARESSMFSEVSFASVSSYDPDETIRDMESIARENALPREPAGPTQPEKEITNGIGQAVREVQAAEKQDHGHRLDERLRASELFAVYSRITGRKLSKQDSSKGGTWSYRGTNTKPRGSIQDSNSPFRTLPRNCGNPTLEENELESHADDIASLMSLAYAKLLKLKKQKEELRRIYNMLDDLENDFMGRKEENTFIERYMEVKVKKDYMLSPGNPESVVEKEDTIKVFGYLGHNTWRIMGPYCKGYCQKNTPLNPRIRSQNQVADVDIVCNSCNKITVPLIGSVPTSILQMRNSNNHSPG